MPGYAVNPGDHIDAPLSNYLAAYQVAAGIADLVMPVVPVKRRTDKFYTWDKAAFLRANDDQRRSRGSKPKVVEPTESLSGMTCIEYELATMIEDGDYANTDSVLRLEQSKAAYLYGLIRSAREKRVANALTHSSDLTAGQLTTGTQLSGTNQWDNASFTAANLERDILVARESVRANTGYDANCIIIPKAVAKTVALNSDIKTLISYIGGVDYVQSSGLTPPGSGTSEAGTGGFGAQRYLPSQLFGLRVFEPGLVENTAVEGAAFSAGDVWGKHVRVLYVNPGPPSMDVPGCGYTFRSTEYGGAGVNVRRWREDGVRGNYLAAGVIDDERVVATDMAYVIRSAIA